MVVVSCADAERFFVYVYLKEHIVQAAFPLLAVQSVSREADLEGTLQCQLLL